jgi:CHASE3 domain sensor protein
LSILDKYAKNEYALQQAAGQCNPTGYDPPTQRKRLEQQREQIQSALDKIDAAISALDAHPELEQFINVMQQAGI